MAARWSAEEHNTLVSLLVNGVSIQSLCDALQSKTEGAIVTRARKKELGLDFRTSRTDGKLYSGVSRRKHIKKDDAETAGTISTSTKLETINTESDEIVSQNSNKDALIAIYGDVSELLKSRSYTSVRSITVKLVNAKFTLQGASHES